MSWDEGSAADSWIGRYGSQGVWIAGVKDEEYLPSNVRLLSPVLQFAGTKPVLVSQNPSMAKKAIHKPDGLSKILAMIYGSYLTFADGTTGWEMRFAVPEKEQRLTLYFYDHYGTGARIELEALTATGVQIDPPITYSEYYSGIYITRTINGPTIVRVRRPKESSTSPPGITGIFLDPPIGPLPDTTSPLISGVADETGTFFTVLANEPITGNAGFILSGQYDANLGKLAAEPIYGMAIELAEQTETTIKYRIDRPRPVFKGEQIALTYTGDGDVKDMAGNPLFAFVGVGVQNDSLAAGPAWVITSFNVLMMDEEAGEQFIVAKRRLVLP